MSEEVKVMTSLRERELVAEIREMPRFAMQQ
jgi:hypothetical protein